MLANKGNLALPTCLVSKDSKLATALASVLGPEFVIVRQPAGGQVYQELPGDQFGAMLFDIDSFSQPCETGELFEDLTRSGIPIIILAGDENRTEAMRLVQRGAHSHVRKPPVVPELRAALRSALESRRLTRELQMAGRQMEAATGLDQLIGTSAPLQLVYKLIRKVTNLDASVLITGESGTGKELICQAIHNTGKRSKRPFVAVSCSAIPETLIEAELFGHDKGAFTGTAGTREGYFEQAGDGTLFLDEIGELTLQMQVKLLRVLQQREFHRLGSSRVIPLRARVVFATNRNLEQMVTNGEFRQDLYYRMNVINIPAPALRHIASDIPVLARHFLLKYSGLYGKIVESITPEALDCLQSYSWPGNIRQLENVMQRALMLSEGYSIEATDLPDIIQDLQCAGAEDNLPPVGSFERALGDYKVKLAHDAIQQCNGSKTLAAQKLSISRAYLHRLIRIDPAAPEEEVAEVRAISFRPALAG